MARTRCSPRRRTSANRRVCPEGSGQSSRHFLAIASRLGLRGVRRRLSTGSTLAKRLFQDPPKIKAISTIRSKLMMRLGRRQLFATAPKHVFAIISGMSPPRFVAGITNATVQPKATTLLRSFECFPNNFDGVVSDRDTSYPYWIDPAIQAVRLTH